MSLPPTIAAYVAPARSSTGAWRVLLGVIAILGIWIFWTVAVLFIWMVIQIFGRPDVFADPASGEMERVLGSFLKGADPQSLLIMLVTFLGVWFGVWMTVRLIHEQRFHTLFAPERRIFRHDFLLGCALGLIFAATTLLIDVAMIEVPRRSDLDLGTWALMFVPIVVLVFFQASSEELIFRGYLLQQLARRVSNPLVWAVLPSFLFGLLHFDSTLPGGGGYYYVATTTVIGCAFAALVWRTGNLWAAMGLHWTNNVMALCGAGMPGILSGMQLYAFDPANLTALMQVDLAVGIGLLALVLSPILRGAGQAS